MRNLFTEEVKQELADMVKGHEEDIKNLKWLIQNGADISTLELCTQSIAMDMTYHDAVYELVSEDRHKGLEKLD